MQLSDNIFRQDYYVVVVSCFLEHTLKRYTAQYITRWNLLYILLNLSINHEHRNTSKIHFSILLARRHNAHDQLPTPNPIDICARPKMRNTLKRSSLV